LQLVAAIVTSAVAVISPKLSVDAYKNAAADPQKGPS